MKILFIGNGNIKHRGERYYDQCQKLYNGFVRGGHNVLFISDRDLTRGYTTLGMRLCNEHVIDACRNFKPDMIALYHADIITPETLARMKEIVKNVRMMQFNVDPIFRPHNIEQITRNLDAVDATFITTAGAGLRRFSRPGKLVSFVPNIVDASIEWPRCFAYENQENDVFWALRALKGSVEHDRRINYPLFLERHGIRIDYHGMNGKPLLYDARYFESIARAKIGINISQVLERGVPNRATDEEVYLYSSDRISHLMGSGLLTFSTRDHRLEEMFAEDREMVFFSDEDELLQKIRYFLANDTARRAIAEAGWKKYHSCYNERLVAQYMVERTMGMPLSQSYQWPVACW